MNFPEYANHVAGILGKITEAGEAILLNQQTDQRSVSKERYHCDSVLTLSLNVFIFRLLAKYLNICHWGNS